MSKDLFEDGVGKHKKRSNRKTPPKSNHKHIFKPCIFKYNGVRIDKSYGFVPDLKLCFGSYCTICGKIGGSEKNRWERTVKTISFNGATVYRGEFTDEAMKELNPETRTLPVFKIDDVFSQKYIDAEDEVTL